MFCRDTGLVHLPDFMPRYRFCKCRAGLLREANEPKLCDEANARERNLGIGGQG